MSDRKPTLCIDTHEIAWAAGFFDGEGNICVSNRKKTYPQITLQVAQSDKRPLDRFARAVGLSVRGPYWHKGKRHLPYFVTAVGTFERVKFVVDLLWPWLSEPKREQARCALDTIEPYIHTRFIHGAGRAILTLEQAKSLRAEYEQLKLGRDRLPRGARAMLADKYGLGSTNTLAAIVGGRGYLQ